MAKHHDLAAPRGVAFDLGGAVPDDPGPWLLDNSPIDLTRNYGGSQSSESDDGPVIDTVVKWFRPDRGYGFVELPEERGDAFLHLNALRPIGRDTLPPGARVRVVVGNGPKGMQVTRVIEIEDSSLILPAQRPIVAGGGAPQRRAPDSSTVADVTGRVKWFDWVRGFGFVAGDDFGRDVFIHCSILGAAGVSRLAEGQAVIMRVVDTPKGREAIEISL